MMRFLLEPIKKWLVHTAYRLDHDEYRAFSELLPYCCYNDTLDVYEQKDGLSFGAIYEIGGLSCDQFDNAQLNKLSFKMSQILKDIMVDTPITVQIYTQYQNGLDEHKDFDYDAPLAKHFSKTMGAHLDWISDPKGSFQARFEEHEHFKARALVTRWVLMVKAQELNKVTKVIEDLKRAQNILQSHFKSNNIVYKSYKHRDLETWLLAWFNPSVKNQSHLKLDIAQRKSHTAPSSLYDFKRFLCYEGPKAHTGMWEFGNTFSAYIESPGFSCEPSVGFLGLAEDSTFLEKLPDNTIVAQTIVLLPQSEVKQALSKIVGSAVGNGGPAMQTRAAYQEIDQKMASGMVVLPYKMGLYVFGESKEKLDEHQSLLKTLLGQFGIHYLSLTNSKRPVTNYIKHLPLAYDYEEDAKCHRNNRFNELQHIANSLPVYQRFKGGGVRNWMFFNQSGECVHFDPLSPADKAYNSHTLWLGETGSGKSSTALYALYCTMAKYNPRVMIIDIGSSFKNFTDFVSQQGLKVKSLEITANNPPPINPFCDALSCYPSLLGQDDTKNVVLEENGRDALNEMTKILQLMVTSGRAQEIEKFSSQDETILLQALIATILKCGPKQKEVLTEDIICALLDASERVENNPIKKARIVEMVDCLTKYTTDLFLSRLFNTPSGTFGDWDVVRIELEDLNEGKKYLEMGILLSAVMGRFNGIAKANQYTGRHHIALFDEFHAIVKNSLTAQTILNFAKTTRKYSLWLWILTQNIQDFKGDIQALLANIEFWMCFGTNQAEIKQIAEHKKLSAVEQAGMSNLKRAHQKYNEAMVLSKKINGIIRIIPPRFIFEIAGTEGAEKRKRLEIMQKYGVSETKACEILANEDMAHA